MCLGGNAMSDANEQDVFNEPASLSMSSQPGSSCVLQRILSLTRRDTQRTWHVAWYARMRAYFHQGTNLHIRRAKYCETLVWFPLAVKIIQDAERQELRWRTRTHAGPVPRGWAWSTVDARKTKCALSIVVPLILIIFRHLLDTFLPPQKKSQRQ